MAAHACARSGGRLAVGGPCRRRVFSGECERMSACGYWAFQSLLWSPPGRLEKGAAPQPLTSPVPAPRRVQLNAALLSHNVAALVSLVCFASASHWLSV